MSKNHTLTGDAAFQERTRRRQAGRELLGTFDSLIRSVRTKASGIAPIAARLLALWNKHPTWEMSVHTDRVTLGADTELLADDTSQGRWILPVFMAGVRSIRLTSEATGDDVLRLAQEVAMLELDEELLSDFRDWLWSDGAEGWKVESHLSFMEMLEVSNSMERSSNQFAAMRASAMLSMDHDIVQIASRELDTATLLPEFQVSVDIFAMGYNRRAFDISEDELRALREGTEDLERWTDAEVQMILDHEVLHGALPAHRLAHRLLSALARHPGPAIVRRLQGLMESESPYAAKVAATLMSQGLLDTLSRLTDVEPPTLRALQAWSSSLGDPELQAWWRKLAQYNVVAAGVSVLESWLRDDVDAWTQVEIDALPSEEALALAHVLEKIDAPEPIQQTYLLECDPVTQATWLGQRPTLALTLHRALLEGLLLSGSDAVIRRVTPVLLNHDPRLALTFAKIMGQRKTPWPRDVVRVLTTHLTLDAEGLGLLADFVRRSRWDAAIREVALEALISQDTPHLAKAIRWRFTELFEPVEFSEKLRTQRKRLRDA